MRNTATLLFVAFNILETSACAATYKETVNGIEWTFMVSGDTASVGTGKWSTPSISTATSGAIIIPETLGGYPVTSIGVMAFYNCSGLTSVTIPDGVTSIGYSAFDGCSGLTSITIPDSVTSIGERTFYNCSGLTSIAIPDGVSSIGERAFYNCYGLTSIAIPDGVTSIGEWVFYNCSGMKSITVPDSVTSIGERAFCNCSGLTSISIPDGVSNIGSSAFSGCSGLTSIVIPDDVTSIENSAFNGCSGLTSIAIPGGVTNIGNSAFNGCSGLTSITIPNSVTNIGGSAFAGCSGLTSITISDSVTSIGNYAFLGCSVLTETIIQLSNPSNWAVNTINSQLAGTRRLFVGDEEVTAISVPDGVTSIGYSAFNGCSGLTSITIPNSVTNIGGSAFAGCSGLTSITIPYGVTSIGDSAFEECSELRSISIPDSVMSFGQSAFHRCSRLLSITIPDGVTNIGKETFSECSSLSSIALPTSVTNIGELAFFECSKLTSVTIQDGLTSIGKWAFYKCSRLTSITIPDSVMSIGSSAFSRCSNLKNLYLPRKFDGNTSSMGIPLGCAVRFFDADPVLTISSDFGTPLPEVGQITCKEVTSISANVSEPTMENGIRHVCTGWTGTGSVPASGTGTNVTFLILENSSITWNWTTIVWLDCTATGFASIAFEPCWTNFGETVVIPFEPKDIGFSWTAIGDTNGVVVDAAARTISIPADRSRTIRFEFSGTTRADAASGGGKPVEWAHGGDAEWFVDFADENDDSGFVRSGEIGTSTNSWTEIAVKGPGRLDFDWRVSCNSRGHYAQVLVDDTQWKRIAGTTDWTSETIEIGEGEHIIRWNYVKGTTSASGEDRACLDNVVWRPYVTLYVYSYGETNGVPYGSSTHLWGDRIEAHAGPTATYENERYVCSGWECRALEPGSGTETNVTFEIRENMSLKWNWSRQVWIEIQTVGPVEIPFENGWATQTSNGTWSVHKEGAFSSSTTTYCAMSATSAVPVRTSVPYPSFLLVGEDVPTSTNHFPMVVGGSSSSLITDIDPPPPEPVPNVFGQMTSTGETGSELVDETPFHRIVFDKRTNVLSFDCTHACRITLVVTEMTLATAFDTHGLDWTTSGADVWFPQDDVSSDGEDAAKSGTVQGDDASVLRTTVTGPGTFSWTWKLAMEGSAGVDVFLDDVPVDGLYDAADWVERSLHITGDGEHEIRFEFWNAGEEATLSDCAYLDRVKWTGKLFDGGTETTPVPVPYEWLNGFPELLEAAENDYEAVANGLAANDANKVWECYVAGLNPTNAAERFLAQIAVTNGTANVWWTPDLNEGGTKSERVYTVEGKANLVDESWGPTNESTRFFRVKVEMP